jgi:C4-dicarboxylate-binding protein DctP
VLFNPTWWSALPEQHRDVIATAFDEIRPEVEKLKEDAQVSALEIIKGAGVNVRVADEAERTALRDTAGPAAREAYLAQGGDEAKLVLEVYDAEYRALTA